MEDYMSDLNIVCLIGRVTKNAELGMAGNAMPFCAFSIATHRSRQVDGEWEETAHYIYFRLFGEKWRGIGDRLKKGCLVSIQGHIEQDTWEQDSKKRSSLKIAADRIRILATAEHSGPEPDERSNATPPKSFETPETEQEGA
jgi:single-strand DNA-binding protein